jgi:hypothetical protein
MCHGIQVIPDFIKIVSANQKLRKETRTRHGHCIRLLPFSKQRKYAKI